VADGGAVDLPPGLFRQLSVTDPEGKEHKFGVHHMVLEYGDNLPKPTLDVDTSCEGIRATLSFNGENRKTFVPWGNVYFLQMPEDGFSCEWQLKIADLEAKPVETKFPKLCLV
jgi:hypothetical protein